MAVQPELLREKPRDLKTVLGIFYTPAPLAEALVDWAVKDASASILEPSFGGCGFLNATARRLVQLGQANPWANIHGCDKDRRAFRYLPEPYRTIDDRNQFKLGDFLELRPSAFSLPAFDVILGNPPYVSRQTMSARQIASAEVAMRENGVKLSSRSSLWAYFILHGLSFLANGGRIAWVLPRSLSQAVYGRQVLEFLRRRFTEISVISLEQRMFTDVGTDEITDVLVGSGFHREGEIAGRLIHHHASSLPGLLEVLSGDVRPVEVLADEAEYRGTRSVALSPIESTAFKDILKVNEARPLQDLIRIKIGLVTGASDFFVLRHSNLATRDLARADCHVILSKYRHTGGLEVTADDAINLEQTDERVLLIRCSQSQLSKRVRRYLATFDSEIRTKVATFAKRPLWYYLDDHETPDAFLPCLVRGSPRMVLNNGGLTCTNNVLRVWFVNSPPEEDRKALALSLTSTPGQITAEAFGRACGSGGLKIEPGDWLAMQLILPNAPPAVVNSAFEEVDMMLRAGDRDGARDRADLFLRTTVPSLTPLAPAWPHLVSGLRHLQNSRG